MIRYSQDSAARLPHCLAIETQGDEVLMVLEDLNAAGYPLRKRSVSWEDHRGLFGLVGTISRELPGKSSRRPVGGRHLLAFADPAPGVSRSEGPTLEGGSSAH